MRHAFAAAGFPPAAKKIAGEPTCRGNEGAIIGLVLTEKSIEEKRLYGGHSRGMRGARDEAIQFFPGRRYGCSRSLHRAHSANPLAS